MDIDPELKELMLTGTAEQRKYICQRSFIYFAIYYFHEYFTYDMAPFHFDMVDDLEDLRGGKFDYLLWVMFREAAKTVWSRMFIIYCICFNLKKYINWDSYDKQNAESSLFDITNSLLINTLLIADFGHLYFEKRSSSQKTLKRVSEFITVNGIKVEAFSTQKSTRGRIFENYRPDLFVLDDFETTKTKASIPVMTKIRDHISEMLAGLGPTGDVIFNCNYITEVGVVHWLITGAEKDPKFMCRRVDAEEDGKPSWMDKYVMTDKEAAMVNKIGAKFNEPPKVSLQSKQRTLNAGGEKIYEMEMLNSPEAAGDLFFDRKKIDELIREIEGKKTIKNVAGRMLWKRFNPSHKYAIGVDTSKGVGLDANAAVGLDFGAEGATGAAEQVLSCASNEIAPDDFAYEVKQEAEDLGEALVAPEINAESGGTFLNQLKNIYRADRIFRRMSSDKPKLGEKPSFKMGWETTARTKPQMMFGLRKALHDDLLKVYDIRILKEARAYTQADLSDTSGAGTTRHFDLLKACAIAWAMRGCDQLSAKQDDLASKNAAYRQPEYEGVSEYEGGHARQPNPYTPNSGIAMGGQTDEGHFGRVF